MKQSILFCLVILLLSGCEKNQVDPLPPIKGYKGSYTVDHKTYNLSSSPIFSLPPNYSNKFFSLDYDIRGRVTKRTWETCTSVSSCEFKEYGPYDLITYNGRSVTIKRHDSRPEYQVSDAPHTFTVNKDNKIVSEVLNDPRYSTYDSTHYYYSAKGILESSVKYRVPRSKENKEFLLKEEGRVFTFDTNGNLTKVVTGMQYVDDVAYKVKTETFGDYDNAPNPFLNLFMFDECLYRSLSKNNFRSYSVKMLDTYYNSESETAYREWVLNYNTDGTPIFDK